MINCPTTGSDRPGIRNYAIGYSSSTANSLIGISVNGNGGRGGTLSWLEVASWVSFIATVISRTVSSRARISSWVYLISWSTASASRWDNESPSLELYHLYPPSVPLSCVKRQAGMPILSTHRAPSVSCLPKLPMAHCHNPHKHWLAKKITSHS